MEKIDQLRALLDIPNRQMVSAVMLNGEVEITTPEDSFRRFAPTDDVAVVFIGPRSQMPMTRRQLDDGTVEYRVVIDG